MPLDVPQLLNQMVTAAAGPLKAGGPKVLSYAQTEFSKVAQTIASIEAQTANGSIAQGEASLLLDMQKNATRAVLAAVEGMSLLLAEQAINASLKAIRGIVNAAVRFTLIP